MRSSRTPCGHRVTSMTCLLAAVWALCLPGCAVRDWFVRKPSPPPRVLQAGASADEIVDHLNNQRARLVGWRSTKVRISASGGLVSPGLNAVLSVESPRNLRLMAESSLRGMEVDFGSNDDRFWFWMRESDPKYILTGSHDSLAAQQAVALPFPPAWLMEALGVTPIDPHGIQLKRADANPDQVQLVAASTLQGRRVQRVMDVDLAWGQIVRHSLYDERGALVASAAMSEFQSNAGIIMPHRIDLKWPEAKMDLVMKIDQIEVNPTLAARTWEIPSYPNYSVVNLDHVEHRGSQEHGL